MWVHAARAARVVSELASQLDHQPGDTIFFSESPRHNITITNLLIEGFFWSLHIKPFRILDGHSKKIEKSYKFSQKTETSNHQSNKSNYNNYPIC